VIEGDVAAKDCIIRFKRNGRVLAVASIFRDVESLQAEVTMEQDGAANTSVSPRAAAVRQKIPPSVQRRLEVNPVW
jgi:hypothetical protein